MTTAYGAVTARIADPIVEIIRVGDRIGNVCLRFVSTLPINLTIT